MEIFDTLDKLARKTHETEDQLNKVITTLYLHYENNNGYYLYFTADFTTPNNRTSHPYTYVRKLLNENKFVIISNNNEFYFLTSIHTDGEQGTNNIIFFSNDNIITIDDNNTVSLASKVVPFVTVCRTNNDLTALKNKWVNAQENFTETAFINGVPTDGFASFIKSFSVSDITNIHLTINVNFQYRNTIHSFNYETWQTEDDEGVTLYYSDTTELEGVENVVVWTWGNNTSFLGACFGTVSAWADFTPPK